MPSTTTTTTTKLLLPSENSRTGVPNQGWSVKTEVRKSTIPGAGNGRFAAEPIAKRSRVCVKKTIEMAKVNRLSDVPFDRTITFTNEAELEKYIRLAKDEGGHTREAVLEQFQNFIWGLDEKRVALNNSTWSMNHGEGETESIIFQFETLPDGAEALVGDAYRNIAVGTEFMNNYRDFVIAPWYHAWTRKNKIVDVRTLVLSIVDNGGHDNDPARLPEGKVGFGESNSQVKYFVAAAVVSALAYAFLKRH